MKQSIKLLISTVNLRQLLMTQKSLKRYNHQNIKS